MKAVRYHECGHPSVLRYEDLEQPTPGAGLVLLRGAATSFNRVPGNIRAEFMRGPMGDAGHSEFRVLGRTSGAADASLERRARSVGFAPKESLCPCPSELSADHD